MGEDSVIVQRDATDRIRVYLNRCPHRGSALCVFDSGSAKAFTCAYHGWTFTDGELTGVPYRREAYQNELDLSAHGLYEVPKVKVYGGLVFATWDANAKPLEEFLGDAKWYLDTFLIREEMGGLEGVPSPQRYIMPVNWKLLAENFAGDDYHFEFTHQAVVQAMSRGKDDRLKHRPDKVRSFSVAANHRSGPPHGFLELRVSDEPFKIDLAHARALGADCAEWVEERQRRLGEKLAAFALKPYSFHIGNIFPNLALIGIGSATYAKGLIQHHPRGSNATEVWVWAAVEKSAPQALKDRQKFVLMQRQAAAGIVAPDDHEIFQRIAPNLRAEESKRRPLLYNMALKDDERETSPPEFASGPRWPGKILPQFSEVIQRDFYRYWAELMDREI
jgi:phenylpropionate dioxygenase-like ring-hydroxylating dioxygenase large terminal subunit